MDEARYGDLLKEIRPRIIETAEEHERLLLVAESMMDRGDSLGPEEREALALIVLLIEAFEAHMLDEEGEEENEESESDQPPAPHVALQSLMSSHGIDLQDIAPMFGNVHLAREALTGTRPISRGQAKELGRYFRVPPRLFQQ